MPTEPKPAETSLLVERNGAVEILIINDPPQNRMGLEFMDALGADIERIAKEPGVRAVVIRGAGKENERVPREENTALQSRILGGIVCHRGLQEETCQTTLHEI